MKRELTELQKRIISGIFVAIIYVGLVLLSSFEIPMRIVVACLCVFSTYEIYRVFRAGNDEISFVLTLIVSFLVPMLIGTLSFPTYVIALPLIMMLAIILLRGVGKMQLKASLFAPAISIVLTVLLTSIFAVSRASNGIVYVAFGIILCASVDVFAYLVGRKLGKRKLCPRISPKKTVEGAIGGSVITLVLVVTTAVILRFTNVYYFNFLNLAVLTVACIILAQLGDLTMSAIKRIVGVKDYGRIIPGHGGILDRIDSFIFVFPFILVFILMCGGIFV